jgi:putative transposase
MDVAIASWEYICEGIFRGDLTGSNPTDRGNRIRTKHHILTDQYGVPLSVVVITAANTHDMKKAATETLDRTVVKRPLKKVNICLDKGYDYPEIERESTKRRYLPHSRQRCGERIDKDRACNEEMDCYRKN